MNKLNLQYSLKNIPIPSKLQYHKQLVSKVENFLTRLRWKMFFILNPANHATQKETYGFKKNNSCPQMKELKPFEDDLLDLISNIQFKPCQSNFQNQLRKDCNMIKNSNDIIVKGDKTSNLYKIPINEYKNILVNNVTKEYKKVTHDEISKVNSEAATIAKSLDLGDRIEVQSQSEAYITIKDHKEDFPNRIQHRLINPAKTNIGIVSKHLLEKLNSELRLTTSSNQWKDSSSVLTWFKTLKKSSNATFFKFDIENFYPSITEELLEKSLTYASNLVSISSKEKEIIFHSRKTFLFTEDSAWVKKAKNSFDVTMGCYDGAEVSELVGLYILHQLEQLIPQDNIGLYRDDGLAVIYNHSGPQIDRLRKNVTNLFKNNSLKVKIECNLKSTDFLDIYLNLANHEFKPFRKENYQIQYINKNSNHPPTIKKQLPTMISKRLSTLSSSKPIFENEIRPYNNALVQAGYPENSIKYIPQHQKNNKKHRSRNILWFNPPYNSAVSTNIARKFLQLIDKHFPKDSTLHKYFNRNNVKVSYSCMQNIQSVINNHNKKLLNQCEKRQEEHCNCKNGINSCPLGGRCQTKSLVYKATVKIENSNVNKQYLGLTSYPFKTRFNSHLYSFRSEKQSQYTGLSKLVWKLKSEQRNFDIKWEIAAIAPSYSTESKKCHLCLTEKTLILLSTPNNSLNQRHEILNKCRDKNKFILNNHPT